MGKMDNLSRQRLAKLISNLQGDLTQEDFGKKLDVTTGAIQAWLGGKVTPSANNMRKIANYAGMTLEELYDYISGKSSSPKVDVEQLATRIKIMDTRDFSVILRAVSERLATIA